MGTAVISTGLAKLDETTATQAGEIALDGAKPLKDNVYKVKMAQDLIHRGLMASL